MKIFSYCERTSNWFVQTVSFLFCQSVDHLLLCHSLSFSLHQTMKCIHAAVTSRLSNAVTIFHHWLNNLGKTFFSCGFLELLRGRDDRLSRSLRPIVAFQSSSEIIFDRCRFRFSFLKGRRRRFRRERFYVCFVRFYRFGDGGWLLLRRLQGRNATRSFLGRVSDQFGQFDFEQFTIRRIILYTMIISAKERLFSSVSTPSSVIKAIVVRKIL